MAVQYDPAIIITFAERLYAQARTIVALCALFGATVGGLAGAAIGELVMHDGVGMCGIFGVASFGLIGFAVGQERAFVLRLRAQEALCKVQIEQNTRGWRTPDAPPGVPQSEPSREPSAPRAPSDQSTARK